MSKIDFTDLDPNSDESLLDLKISWRFFKANVKTFMGFVFAGYFIVLIFQIILTLILVNVLQAYYGEFTVDNLNMVENITYILLIPMMIFLFAYFGSVFGLAYDLLSSGDQYTHFRSSFYYFKKNGWQYVVIEILKSTPIILFILLFFPNQTSLSYNQIDEFDVWSILLISIFSFIWFVLFVMTVPSVTSHGSIKNAFKDNWNLLKRIPKRIFKSFGIYFLIFQLPIYVLLVFQEAILSEMVTDWLYVVVVFIFSLIAMILGGISNPMSALISTRIYNMSENIVVGSPSKDEAEPQIEVKRDF